MAKKQSSKISNSIDLKALYSKLAQEREALIRLGEELNFQVKYMKGMFVVRDKLKNDEVKAFTTNQTLEPKDYTVYVRNYMNKVRGIQ